MAIVGKRLASKPRIEVLRRKRAAAGVLALPLVVLAVLLLRTPFSPRPIAITATTATEGMMNITHAATPPSPSAMRRVWLRGTNGRLDPNSECTPVPSWGFWRARCAGGAGTTPQCYNASSGALSPRTVLVTFGTNITVTRALCSGSPCGSRYPAFTRVEGGAATWRVDVGACPHDDDSGALPDVVDGPATDVYLDIEVLEDSAALEAETCFLSVGDWGKEGPWLTSVAEAMNRAAEANPAVRFVVSTGDNFYEVGVSSIDDPQFQSAFERPFGQPLMKQLMWLISVGNHDQAGLQGQYDYSVTSKHPKHSERWYFPQGTYSVEMPVNARRSMRLVVMDTFGQHPERMVQFMEAEMVKANSANRSSSIRSRPRRGEEASVTERWRGGAEDWRIVVNHAPMYCGSYHGVDEAETGAARALIKPTVDRVKAHMYISGHDHVLEVHRDDQVTDYFVSGAGGGNGVKTSIRLPTTQYYDPQGVLGFMQHCFKGDTATTTVYGVKSDQQPLFVYKTPLRQKRRKEPERPAAGGARRAGKIISMRRE